MNTPCSFDQPNGETAGIYVHIPFCLSRCEYCAFTTTPFDSKAVNCYIDLLAREIELVAARPDIIRRTQTRFDTIYFGGGTPSLLDAEQVRRVIDVLRACFAIGSDLETTIEINPATADVAGLKLMRDAGVNRASLGVQSLSDDELRLMGRTHTAREGLTAFEDLRAAGFDNVSIDLIAGFPGQTLESVSASLRSVMRLCPEHLSVYLLEVKPGSRLAHRIACEEVPPPDEDLAALMYEEICRIAADNGFEQYEISNFAQPGRRSRHNLKYWHDCDYLGFGAGAAGLINDRRYANHEQTEAYRQAVERGELPTASVTELSTEDRFRDALIMGLRLVEGIDPMKLGARYRIAVRSFVHSAAHDLEDAGLLTIGHERIALTPRGRLLSNMVFSRFI